MMLTRWNSASPSLLESIVCYADILGFRAMTERNLESGRGRQFLWSLKGSLSKAYKKVRDTGTLDEETPPIFDMKVFTDNIVVAYPRRNPDEDAEPELGSLMMLFAQVQAGLAADGFFLRGAIAAGRHYQDQDIAFGEALLEAVDLDKSGKPPRMVIAPSVEPLISLQLESYGDGPHAPHYDHLLEDPCDERLFVNYLSAAFEYFPDGLIDYQLLAAHKGSVLRGLRMNESNPEVLQKYTWIATYHNYVCRTFADRFPIRADVEGSPEEVAVSEEAQCALDYLVPNGATSTEQTPRPLNAQRLRKRLDARQFLT